MSKKIDVSVEIPVFDGFEFARFGHPEQANERYWIPGDGVSHGDTLSKDNVTHVNANNGCLPRMIYRPIKVDKWRPATMDDVQRVMNGETVIARFTDVHPSYRTEASWVGADKDKKLRGINYQKDGILKWWATYMWSYCEVLESE